MSGRDPRPACERWERLLPGYLDGELAGDAAAWFLGHARECPDCGVVLEAVVDPPAAADEELTAGILAATTGPACRRAGERLAEMWDVAGAAGTDPFLAAHLQHCPSCRDLARVVAWLPGELASLGVPEPDEALVTQIVHRTMPLLRRRRLRSRPRVLLDRWRSWWESQLQRPRFPVEVALAASLVLLLAGWVPGGSSLLPRGRSGAIEASPAWIATRTVGAVRESGRVVARLRDGLASLDGRLAPCRRTLERDLAAAAGDLVHRRWSRLREDLRLLAGDAACLRDAVLAPGGTARPRTDTGDGRESGPGRPPRTLDQGET